MKNRLLSQQLLYLTVFSFFIIFIISCDFGLVDILSEDEYEKLNPPYADYNDIFITLEAVDTSCNYIDDTLRINMELSEAVRRYNISEDHISVKNGKIINIKENDPDLYDEPTKSFTISVVSESSAGDIEIFIPPETIKDYKCINKSASNVVTIKLDLFDHGYISDLTWTNDTQLILGLDYDNGNLLSINPVERSMDILRDLENTFPNAMKYSESDNKLYVVSTYSGDVDIYNLYDNTAVSYQFSPSLDGRDVEIDTARSRIYILTDGGKLVIMDMTDGSVLNTATIDSYIGSIVYDEINQLLYGGDAGYSPSSIFRYSVAGDGLNLQEELSDAGSNGSKIVINPDRTIVCLPCGGGNTGGYTIDAFDASNLNNVLGTWDVGTYPEMAFFNPVKDIFYGSNGYDNDLYIMNSVDYSLIRKVDIPENDDYLLFTTNIDGTTAVGSTDDYFSDNTRILFFTDID